MALEHGLKKELKPINNSGIYLLELFVEKGFDFNHNKLKQYNLPKGFYYYVGSAQKNLSQRIERHLKKYKKQHWHIDYLTCNNNVIIKNVYLVNNYSKNYECILVSELQTKFDLKIIIEGFGNSDCNSCESHLLYSKKQLDYNHLCSLYQETVLFIPSSNDIS